MTLTGSNSGQLGGLNPGAAAALRAETEFLAGVEVNLEAAKGRQLRGDRWTTVRDDDGDALRAAMAGRRMYDRELLKQLPHNRRVALHGSERRWLFLRRKTGVAVGSALASFDALLSPEGEPRPVGLADVTDHVRKLVADAKVPHVIGVCSPSGFTDEVLQSRLDLPNVTLVLAWPRPGGGWSLATPGGTLSEELRNLFDPEGVSQKIARARREIEASGVDLLTGGLSARSIAERTGLPDTIVSAAFALVATEDGELRVARKGGEVLLYRGAPARIQESGSMNVVDRIRQLFSREGEETQKINMLSERRARLAQRRDRLYEDISTLEKREGELLAQGRSTQSQVTRRRLAAQLAQLRKDIARQNTTANMLNQQINILSTDIHNLTLIQQGQMARLPDTEELTQNAVKAEEMLETLRADADLVGSLETGLADVATSSEEMAILKEFETAAERGAPQVEEPEDVRKAMAEFDEPAPPSDKQKGRAEPEA